MRQFLVALTLSGAVNGLFGQVLYVGNFGDRTISAYVIDQESGRLTELRPRVSTPGAPTSVAVHPGRKFAYVTTGGPPNLAAYSIDASTGALTLAGSTPLTLGSNPQSVAIDPSGKFAFVAQPGSNNVAAFSIDPATGATTAVPGSPFAAPQNPNCVVAHPNGKFAYASAGGAGQIAAYGIGADGALAPVAGSPFPARNNLFWMAMDPAGKFLFAVERQDNAVLVYSVNADTGALTQVGSPFPAGAGVTGIAVDPAGRFLYVSAAFTGSVTVFNIDATGALRRAADVGAVLGAFAAILDPSGKYLYVPGQQANAVRGLAVDSNSGALTPLPPFFPAGVQPQRGAAVLFSPPVLPPIRAEAAFNAFSLAPRGMPNSGIAPGSRLSISGANIGPAEEISATAEFIASAADFPLKTELGGVSVRIQSGDVTAAAIPLFASDGLVTAILPSTIPLGDATVTLAYKDRTTTPIPITIVAASPGIATYRAAGHGPAIAVNNPASFDDALSNPTSNALTQPVKPGQRVGVLATGLGPVGFDELQALSQDLDVPVDAIVGNKPATVLAKRRDSRFPGADLVLIQLPEDAPEGCYVPIAIRAGGVTSNVATISISATGSTCSDTTGFAASDLEVAQRSGQLNIGTIQVSHIELEPLAVFDEAAAVFERYGSAALANAFAPGAVSAGIRQSFGTPALGTCAVSPGAPVKDDEVFDLPGDRTGAQGLNAGVVNLSGPKGRVQLAAPVYYRELDPGGVTPGDYTADNGAGTQAVGTFQAPLTLPPMLEWTNKDGLASPDRSQDLTVTWNGGLADKEFALIVGLSTGQQATGGFLCAEKVSAGKFTVPAWVLSSLPPSVTFREGGQTFPAGLLAVGTAPLTSTGRFTATGLDFAVFTYEQARAILVSYQ